MQLGFDGIACAECAAITQQLAFAAAQQAVAPLQQALGRERREQLPLTVQLPLPSFQVSLQQSTPLVLPQFWVPLSQLLLQPVLDAASPMASALIGWIT